MSTADDWGEAARDAAKDESSWQPGQGDKSPAPAAAEGWGAGGDTPPRRERSRSPVRNGGGGGGYGDDAPPRRDRTPPRRDPPRDDYRGRSGGGDDNPNPGNNLHVSSLSIRVTDRDLEDMFVKYGKVDRAQVMYDPHTKDPRGFAFVTMSTSEEADAAMSALNGAELLGRNISIQKARRARARTPTPGRYFGPAKDDDRRRGGFPPPRGGGYGGPGYPPRDDFGPPRGYAPRDDYGPPRGDPYGGGRGDPYGPPRGADPYARGLPRDYPPRGGDYPPPRGDYGRGGGYDAPRGPPRGYDDAPPPRRAYDDAPPPRRYDDGTRGGGAYDPPPPPPGGRSSRY